MAKAERPPSEDCVCPHCRRSFSTLDAFDRHRVATRGKPMDLHCVDPEQVPGLSRHVGRKVWGLVKDVGPEWCGPFTQLEIPLPRRPKKTSNEKRINQ